MKRQSEGHQDGERAVGEDLWPDAHGGAAGEREDPRGGHDPLGPGLPRRRALKWKG